MSTELTTIPTKLRKPKPKELKFLKLYLETANPAQSYINAGYSPKGAEANSSRMIKKDFIRSYLDHLVDEAQAEHQDIFSSLIKRTNALVHSAEREGDKANALKGIDQLAKLGHMYDKANAPGEDRPAFVGISIHMGDKPSVEVIRKLPSQATPAIEHKAKSKDTTS